jgi:hypothetical protein
LTLAKPATITIPLSGSSSGTPTLATVSAGAWVAASANLSGTPSRFAASSTSLGCFAVVTAPTPFNATGKFQTQMGLDVVSSCAKQSLFNASIDMTQSGQTITGTATATQGANFATATVSGTNSGASITITFSNITCEVDAGCGTAEFTCEGTPTDNGTAIACARFTGTMCRPLCTPPSTDPCVVPLKGTVGGGQALIAPPP